MIDLSHLRADFPILATKMNGKPLVYLDSASTTQKPQQVLDAMDGYYATHNANVHRAAYALAADATEAFEGARATIATFIGAATPRELVFTRGTTTAMNFIAWGWGMYNLEAGDKVVLTALEHHANVVPWQLVRRFTNCELVYLPLTDDYLIDTAALEDIVDERVKMISVSGMSNVLGTIGPLEMLSEAARRVGALVAVDAAQLVPHSPVDVQALDVDFLAFGAHKMLGPTGVGALWGRLELLEEMEPAEGGGEMIRQVELLESTWNEVPHKFEAGTPPIAEAIGFAAAADYLSAVGMDVVRRHEMELTGYALQQLEPIPDLELYGPRDPADRGGAVSFTLADIHPHDLQTILDEDGIAIRAGHHCAQPLMRLLDVPATARASFYLYNTPEEVDLLVAGLHKARRLFGVD